MTLFKWLAFAFAFYMLFELLFYWLDRIHASTHKDWQYQSLHERLSRYFIVFCLMFVVSLLVGTIAASKLPKEKVIISEMMLGEMRSVGDFKGYLVIGSQWPDVPHYKYALSLPYGLLVDRELITRESVHVQEDPALKDHGLLIEHGFKRSHNIWFGKLALYTPEPDHWYWEFRVPVGTAAREFNLK